MNHYDVIVIGGGPSGQSASVRLAQNGKKVAVVERDFIGGICVNWGCTPSKAMIESAKIAEHVREAGHYGVEVNDFQINFNRIAERRNAVVKAVREETEDLLRHHKIDIYQGEAIIEAVGKVAVKGGKLDIDAETMHYDGKDAVLIADHIIMATGSAPLIPPGINAENPFLVNSNRLISIDELPESLTIVGGGVIGIEFATIFSNLGSKVTVIEFLDRVVAGMDEDISAEITRILEEKGVKILTGYRMTEIDENGVVTAECRHNEGAEKIRSSMTLLSIGRQAVVDSELCERLGLEFTQRGIVVDDHLHTNVPSIYAVGDATGKSILAHVGIQQGLICAENILKSEGEEPRAMNYDVIPAVIYSLPEIVSVGVVPEDLTDVQVVKVPFSKNLRAAIEERGIGFLKLWIKDYKVIAAQALGYVVSEIIQELTNMIALGTDTREVAKIIHPHPTYAEITRSALEYALDQAVDFYL
ncbi:MAG: dihydrolipoyl dehydrogenase [Anaerolineaceae bacterium]|nr:dihydrolipoyl dehydrogenase [Anaerolineaceae bacterium]